LHLLDLVRKVKLSAKIMIYMIERYS